MLLRVFERQLDHGFRDSKGLSGHYIVTIGLHPRTWSDTFPQPTTNVRRGGAPARFSSSDLFLPTDQFQQRHLGPLPADVQEMCKARSGWLPTRVDGMEWYGSWPGLGQLYYGAHVQESN